MIYREDQSLEFKLKFQFKKTFLPDFGELILLKNGY